MHWNIADHRAEYWARQRKFTHSYLTGATNARYNGIMEFEAKRWMARLLENPDDFVFSLEDMCSKVMCQLTWADHSLSIPLTPSAWGLLTQMSPAGPITNVLTPLWDWVPEPINPWKIRERKRHDEQQAFFMNCLQNTKKNMADGKQQPCFTKNYLETAEKTSISGDYEASCVIGMMALVGIFTVTGPIYYFLISMVHHPEWQVKCQEEIDRVCGDKPPAVADLPNLPILRACIKETMRWKPTVPTGKSMYRDWEPLLLMVTQVLHMRLKPMTGFRVSSSPRALVSFPSTGPSSVIPSSTPSPRSFTPSAGWKLDGQHSRSH